MTLRDFTISDLMACMFEKDFSKAGSEEAWNSIYTEYVDLSGAANTREVTIQREIFNIECRLNYVHTAIGLHIKCYNEFGKPLPQATLGLKSLGHQISWNGDWNNFELQLKMIEAREKKKIAERDKFLKELKELQKGNLKPATRTDFLRLVITIEKHLGFAIDRGKRNAEDFALMVKDYHELAEAEALAASHHNF